MVELEKKSLKVFDWILFIKLALVFLFFFLFYNKLLTELKTTTCWPVTCTSTLTKNYSFCSLLSVTEVYRKKLINNFLLCHEQFEDLSPTNTHIYYQKIPLRARCQYSSFDNLIP